MTNNRIKPEFKIIFTYKKNGKRKASKPERAAVLRMSNAYSKDWKAGIFTKGRCH